MKRLSLELCEKSSLHGLQHLVSRGRMLWERVLWAVLLACVAVVMMLRVYSLWQATYEGSVVTVVENPHYDLSLVDFPAVTVCPNIKAVASKVAATANTYLRERGNLSEFENTVVTLSLMRFPFLNLPQELVTSENLTVYPVKGEDVLEIMSRVGVELDDMMTHCKWRSVRYDCKDLFQRSITLEGYCYSFNLKSMEKLEHNLLETSLMKSTEDIRLRSNVFGRNSGLGFRLKALGQHKLKSDVLGDSYSLGIHNPATIPDFYQMMTVVPFSPQKLTQISVSVATIEADDSLYGLDESVRGCKLANDSSPTIRCLYNCLDEILLKQCSCLPYYRYQSERVSAICGVHPSQLSCLSDINHRLWFDHRCPCRNPCADTFYTANQEELPVVTSSDTRKWTRVRVVYKNLAVKYSRTSSNDFRDFLVGCGSYASLLLGFNAVVAVDFIIYFVKLFLVLFCPNLKRKYIKMAQKKEARNNSNDVKSGSFIRYKNGKNRNISKADTFFIRTCNRDQLDRIFNSNEIASPVYPFIN